MRERNQGAAGNAKLNSLAAIPMAAPRPRPKPPANIADDAPVEELLKHAAALYDAGLEDKAMTACWKAVQKVDPRFRKSKKANDAAGKSALYQALCHALQGAGDHQAAALAASRAVAFDASLLTSHLLLAAALYRAGQWEEAAIAAEQGLLLDSQPVLLITELLSVFVDCQLSLGNPEKALAAVHKSLAASQDNPGLLRLAGKLARRMGRIEEAISWLTRASFLLANRDAAALNADMGDALCGEGRFAEAERYYNDALRLDPAHAGALYGLINARHANGDELKAHRIRQAAINLADGFLQRNFDFYFPIQIPPLGASRLLDKTVASHALLVNGLGVYPAIPLGIAAIKAYVEKLSNHQVTCVDLNALHFKLVIDALRNGSMAFTLAEANAVSEAFGAAASADPQFFNDTSYKRLSADIVGILSFIKHTFEAQCERAFRGAGPSPWYVLAYARHVLSAQALSVQALSAQALSAKPGVVGFSVSFPSQLAFAAVLARMIKAMSQKTVIVFGGGLFTRSNIEGFLAEPFVDYVVIGEGEQTFLKLMDALNGQGSAEKIPGIAFLDQSSKRFIKNAAAAALNSNDLPFADFSDLDLAAYYAPKPVFPALSSRGCYWRRCTFCNHFASYAGAYKASSIDRFVDELAHHAASGVDHFTFVDEMLSAKRLYKIASAIIKRGLDIKFYALAKPTADFTKDILKTMRKAGCLCIYWGQESGSPRILAMMDKGNDVASSAQTLKLSHQAGINNHLFLIVGYPSETLADLRLTLDFVYDHRQYIDAIIGGNFVLCEGTPVRAHYQRFGIRKIHPQRSLCDHRLLDYEIDGAICQKTAARYARILHTKYFRHFSRFGVHFGTPRDHIIAIYANRQDLPNDQERDIPSPGDIWPLLLDPKADAKADASETNYAITPSWNFPLLR